MHRLIAPLLALGLAACQSDKAPPTGPAFRPASAPIYSSAVLDSTRLAGVWREVAAFAPQGAACKPGGGMRLAGDRAELRLCLGGRSVTAKGKWRVTGPGRLALPGIAEPVWVLWADGDYRTLVLGTPSGRFGMVLDRGSLSPDRETAAREILDWNGYDLGAYSRL